MNNAELLLSEIKHCQVEVEKYLEAALPKDALPKGALGYEVLLSAMRYSLLAGGKRIRAAVCLKFCEACGGSFEDALPAACAIEMLHSYTLIHDDMPCMDDDSMRRGKPANHIEFGEFTAMLAGDAMQALAFDTLLKSELPAQSVVEMAKILAQAAGPHGVCAGQYLDLSGEGTEHTLEELLQIYSLKTSALFSAAAQMGAIAGGGTQEQVRAAGDYAQAVGLAFQAQDDILDCISTAEQLGKPIGSDADNEKSTLASILGIEKCKKLVQSETDKAVKVIEMVFPQDGFLRPLADYLVSREY